jgi:hypothetical protein
MNQNEMDRYYWRAGQRWSSDSYPFERARRKVASRAILFLLTAFALTTAMLLLQR